MKTFQEDSSKRAVEILDNTTKVTLVLLIAEDCCTWSVVCSLCVVNFHGMKMSSV